MLSVEDLHSGYGGVPILVGVNVNVVRQEYVGILGHNGMGKSTLLKTLIGLIKPTAGRILLDGCNIAGWPPHRRSRSKIAYVPQGRQIFPNLTVLENLKMAVSAHGLPEAVTIDQVLEELPRLQPLRSRIGGALSGGEQQILAIARAMCTAPRLLLLDEPTEGIQPSIREDLGEILLRLKSSRHMTLLLVEQNLDFIKAVSDRILVMEKGQVRGDLLGSPATALGFVSEVDISNDAPARG